MNEKDIAYFAADNDYFVGLDAARGPWSPDHCHAGPVAGLIARAVEQVVAGKALARLTIDLVRPLPMNGLHVVAQAGHDGRRLATAKAIVTDRDGRLCATATSMHLAGTPVGPVPTAPVKLPRLDEAGPGSFPSGESRHGLPGFADYAEIAYPPGESGTVGPTTLWMKTPPLLAGENLSPFQLLCPLADCGNGISRNVELSQLTFVNTDLTIVSHRRSSSVWLASRSQSHWDANGVGQSVATIMDEEGVVATAVQTLLLMRPQP